MGHEYRVRIPRRPHVLLTAAISLAAVLTWSAAPFAHKKPKPAPPPPPSLTVAGRVEVGRHPRGVDIYAGHGIAVVANEHSGTVSLVDLDALTEVAEIPVGHRPIDVAVNSSTGVAVVTLAADHDDDEDGDGKPVKGLVALVDLISRVVIDRVPVGRRPWGVAVDPGLNIAIVANRNSDSVSIVDLEFRITVAEFDTGHHPVDVSVNPRTHVAAVANLEGGTITLVDVTTPATPALAGIVPLPRHARPQAVAFDYAPGLNRIVVADSGKDAMHVVTLDGSNQPTGTSTLPLKTDPRAVAVDPGNEFALLAREKDDVVGANPATALLASVTRVGKRPRGVAIDPGLCLAAVTNWQSNSVTVLEVPCRAGLTITSLDPATAELNAAFTLEIRGRGFDGDAVINIGTHTGLTPTTQTATLLTLQIPIGFLAAGTYNVSVTSGGETVDAPQSLTIVAPPPLTLTSVSPAVAEANGSALTLTLRGQSFRGTSTVTFGTSAQLAPLVNPFGCALPLCLEVVVPGALTLEGGVFDVQVHSDGVDSNTQQVTLLNPAPQVASLDPATAPSQGFGRDITIIGSGFRAASQVLLDGVSIPAVQDPSSPTTRLIATIPAAIMQTPGTYAIQVFTPAPGGGLSSPAKTFTVEQGTGGPTATKRTLVVPEGQPRPVAIYAGLSTVGVAAVPMDGSIRLVDLTDPSNPTLQASISLGTIPGSIRDVDATPASERIVVSLFDDDEVAIVDTLAFPVAVVKVVVGDGPHGVTVDRVNNRALVVNELDRTLSIIDLGGTQAQGTIDLDPGQLLLVHPTLVAVDGTAGVNRAAVLDVGSGGAGNVLVVDLGSGAIVSAVAVGNQPSAIAIDPNTHLAVVTNQGDGTISVVDVSLGVPAKIGLDIPVGSAPNGVSVGPLDIFNPTSSVALVSSAAENNLALVNVTTGAPAEFLMIGTPGAIDPIDVFWLPGEFAGVALISMVENPDDLVVVGLPNELLPGFVPPP